MIKLVEEGGYYHESYRSDKYILVGDRSDESLRDHVYSLSKQENRLFNLRPIYTLIYYLLDGDQFSAFHKVKYDEIWHFYKGSSVNLYVLNDNEKLLNIKLGNDIKNHEQIQYVIKGNTWFGADITDKSSYSLIGCSVSPGFDFRDFELGEREKLKKIYPHHEYIINRLTRK
jgi:predicted cupin superfamily sugar epimerase